MGTLDRRGLIRTAIRTGRAALAGALALQLGASTAWAGPPVERSSEQPAEATVLVDEAIDPELEEEQHGHIDVIPVPQLSLPMGTLIPLAPRRAVSFSLDVELAARIMIANLRIHDELYAIVRPALAYSHDSHPQLQGHRLIAGAGLGVGTLVVAGYVMPSFVYAGADGLGVRTALRGDFGFGLLTLELSHQWLQGGVTEGPQGHAMRVMLGLDILVLLGVVVFGTAMTSLGKRLR